MNDKIDKANISSETNEKLAVQVRHQHGTTKRKPKLVLNFLIFTFEHRFIKILDLIKRSIRSFTWPKTITQLGC